MSAHVTGADLTGTDLTGTDVTRTALAGAPEATVSAGAAPGLLAVEPVDPERDAAVVQSWLAHPASSWWEMGDLDVDGVRDYLTGVQADPAQAAWLGRRDGEPCFLVETYDPAAVLLTDVWAAEPGDVGMHLLVAPAPADRRVHGLTSAVMRAVVEHCRDVLGARRVVVEPDVRNTAVQAKNAEVGFRALRQVDVDGKRALLSVLDTDRIGVPDDDGPAAHLRPEHLEPAERHLVAKAIAEFTHERLIEPVPDGEGWRLDAGDSTYRFRARQHVLEHWSIDEASLTRTRAGTPASLSAQEFVLELHEVLGIPDELLGTYLEEIASTLASAAAKHRRGGPSAAQLARGRAGGSVEAAVASFQDVEAAMTEGHPAFVAANGRIGFGLDEYRAFAPEVGGRFRYRWLAARRQHTHLALAADRTERDHWSAELDPQTIAGFRAVLVSRGLDPDDYVWIPVHPWQWQHRIAVTFAPDLGRQDLVDLGEGPDEYQPQQSIRTAFDRSDPTRSYVKTALAVQNMGFLRGMSPAYMRNTPAVNDWVESIVTADPTLTAAGFSVLREHAAIGYTGDAYHRVDVSSPQRKMLAALWRESPLPRVTDGERLLTMAALLHRDASGNAVVSALIEASGLPADEWVRRWLDAYLLPVVHCLTVHDLVFMPHGENLVLVVRDGAVVRAVMKDIGEEAAVLGRHDDRPVPADIDRIVHPVSDDEAALAVFTDVFDGVLRFVAAILDDDGVLPEGRFWEVVGECIDAHAAAHPDRRRPLDLRVPTFEHSCLNRLQLRNTLSMVDLADQSSSLIRAGAMANPIGR
ncbi:MULTISPECIES: GNAT family N-acetyltransferase [unclassified Curtobacterium]|uniref:GNAT family N-acetyltransferase n=1 Tax=unclassified Curtobacterium TaxID=257496 RepID=UPI0010E5D65F|nr:MULTISPECIES: GNAT family N-acetyltransferase [unclassified Curtobacterium]TCU49736.1 siderophore synthetase component [Curtobacterium sp. PhB146]TCU87384.1 siderophore synthetase component [Curtobacterium sp. PhB191]